MTEQFKQYIVSLINSPFNSSNHLDIITSLILFLPDLSLYVSIFCLILWFGLSFRRILKMYMLYEMIYFAYIASYVGFFLLLASSLYVTLFDSDFNWVIGVDILNGSYHISIYTQVVKMVAIALNLGFYRILSIPSAINAYAPELPILAHIAITLIFSMISFNHFALLLLALEGFSLILYVFTVVERSYGGVIAGVKYFTFGTLGSLILLWGVAHIYVLIPSLSYNVIFQALEYINSNLSTEALEISRSFNFAFTLIILGLLIKLGAAPLHQWVADVYAGAPMVITNYYSTVVKFIVFVIFIRIAYFVNVGDLLTNIAIVSLLVGCYFSLRQQEIKRLLAYSSIVHVSFLLMGDISSGLTYILVYIIASLLTFSILASIRINGQELVYLNDLKHIRKGSLFNTALLIIAFASMAGLPPFAGFFGKFSVWVSLIEDIYLGNSMNTHVTLLISIILSLLTIFYYIRLMQYIFTGSDDDITTAVTSSLSYSPKIFKERNLSFMVNYMVYRSYIAEVIDYFHISLSRLNLILAALLFTWVHNYFWILEMISSISSSLTLIS